MKVILGLIFLSFLIVIIIVIHQVPNIGIVNNEIFYRPSGIGLIDKEDTKCKGCNVILITADAMRADHLSLYGYYRDTSPFLEQLSQNSFVFTNTVSQCGGTPCSIASIMTSRFPYLDNLTDSSKDGFFFKDEEFTIAEFLRSMGYKTGAVVSNVLLTSEYNFGQGFEIFDDQFKYYDFEYSSDECTNKAIGLIDEVKDEKFFLWVHYIDPHSPYWPPTDYKNFFNIDFNEEESFDSYILYGEITNTSNNFIRLLELRYDQEIRFLDDEMRRLYQKVVESGLDENTMVIFSSDHGESVGEHNIFDHWTLYQGAIHVPLVIKLPSKIGARIVSPAMSVDLVPTILSSLGIHGYSETRGIDLLDDFEGLNKDRIQYSEHGMNQDYALIRNSLKLIVHDPETMSRDTNMTHYSPGTYELYNISDDYNEINNIVEDEKVLNQMVELSVSFRLNNSSIEIDDEYLDKLYTLGYYELLNP